MAATVKLNRDWHPTVFEDDVRAHLGRVLTMLDEVDNLIEGDERERLLAVGLLAGARAELRTYAENLR